MRTRLGPLLAAAERLTVDLIAQVPVTVRPTTDTPGYARHIADSENFDVLPVVEDDGRIVRLVRREVLDEHQLAESWEHIRFDPIRADEIVSSSTPLLEVLERFTSDRPRLFVLGRRNIEGIATIYDLNQPAAHQLGFSLALVVEAELARAIEENVRLSEQELDIEVDEQIARAVLQLPGDAYPGARGRVAAWRRKARTGEQVRLAQELVFNDKIGLVEHMDLAPGLAHRCGAWCASPDELLRQLRAEVKELRNAVAHDRELPDETAIWQWMLTTYRLAQGLGAPRD